MALKAPLACYEKIYTLPMLTIKEDKGTYAVFVIHLNIMNTKNAFGVISRPLII